MNLRTLAPGIVISAGVVIMTLAAIGGLHAMSEWSDAYHGYVNSRGDWASSMRLYETELTRAAYAWIFDIGVIVSFGGVAVLAFERAFDKIRHEPEKGTGHKQTLTKKVNEDEHEHS